MWDQKERVLTAEGGGGGCQDFRAGMGVPAGRKQESWKAPDPDCKSEKKNSLGLISEGKKGEKEDANVNPYSTSNSRVEKRGRFE